MYDNDELLMMLDDDLFPVEKFPIEQKEEKETD